MKQTVFLFMFFLLISCSNRDINGDATISNKGLITFKPDYENDSIKRPYPIDNFIDSIKYLKLEFSEESLIGDISSLEVYKDHIYIMDMQTQSIFIYTMEGKFIKRIHSVGNGPKEYTQIDYFSIDKNCDHLIVSDLMGYWVIRYDLKGNFINRTKIPFWIDGIYPTENKGYILFANKRNNKQYFKQEFSLYIVDSLMKIKKNISPTILMTIKD